MPPACPPTCGAARIWTGRPAGTSTWSGWSWTLRWRTSTFADLGLPHVDGPYPRGYRFSKRFGDLIFQASLTDQRVHDQLSQVRNLPAHPDTLSSPGLLARALRHSLRPASG